MKSLERTRTLLHVQRPMAPSLANHHSNEITWITFAAVLAGLAVQAIAG